MKSNRRDFLKGMASIGAGLAITSAFQLTPNMYSRKSVAANMTSTLYGDSSIKRSICLMCHSGCGIQCHISSNGDLVRIRGNPYHPNNKEPNLDYKTDPTTINELTGHICAKGISGIQQLYDPNRITHPLKRAGPRGSGKWEVITWSTALQEIVNGGTLPNKDDSGTYNFEGLKKIYADGLASTPANSDDPALGTTLNQLVFTIGRSEHGRKELTQRLWGDSFGTWNYQNDHTSICELSHHIAYKFVTNGASHLKPDFAHCEYAIFFGSRIMAANFPFTPNAHKIIKAVVERSPPLKLVIIDPQLSKSASKSYRWLPVIPGQDAALVMGMISEMLSNNWYNKVYLTCANKDATDASGFGSFTNSTYLVDITTGELFLQNSNPVVVDSNGNLLEVTSGTPIYGILEPNYQGNTNLKTGFELLKVEISQKTTTEWATTCGIDANIIKNVAKEFWEHAPKSVADFYRGAVQHPNGYYNAIAIITLNLLVGNVNMKGGMTSGGSHWHEMGGKSSSSPDMTYSDNSPWPFVTGGTTFSLKSFGTGSKTKKSGIGIGRDYGYGKEDGLTYEDTVEFASKSYPPKRPWFPLTTNIWQEVFAGIAEKYPYQAKCLITHMANPTYSSPATSGPNGPLEEKLKDSDILPLFVSIDCFMGETSSISDYILPDVTYLERFATPHVSPSMTIPISGVRQPVLGKYDPNDIDENGFPGGTAHKLHKNTYMAEDIYLQLAARIVTGTKATNANDWLPGFGPNGFGTGNKLENAWDWYKAAILVIALEGDPVVTKDSGESTEDYEQRLIDYILDRGGRFGSFLNDDGSFWHIDESSPDLLKNKTSNKGKDPLNLYSETVGKTINLMGSTSGSITKFKGVATYEKIKFTDGSPVEDKGFNFNLITHKDAHHTQSRTASIPYLMDLENENFIEMNSEDASGLEIMTNDLIKITSASNDVGIIGKAKVIPGIRPGVITISHAYGHFAYGSEKWTEIDDSKSSDLGGEEYIGKGVQSNYVMRLDKIGLVGLQDLIGGSAAFFSTKVKIEKV